VKKCEARRLLFLPAMRDTSYFPVPTIIEGVAPRRRRSEIEFAFLTLEPVDDCVVLSHHVSGEERLIAYLVLRGPLPRAEIREHLENARLPTKLPDHYVIVNRLPFTESGELDERALAKVSIVDESLAQHVEEMLTSDPRVQMAAVLLEEDRTAAPVLRHERQLLPPSRAHEAWASSSTSGVRLAADRALVEEAPATERESEPRNTLVAPAFSRRWMESH
jgi:hypothetical protein